MEHGKDGHIVEKQYTNKPCMLQKETPQSLFAILLILVTCITIFSCFQFTKNTPREMKRQPVLSSFSDKSVGVGGKVSLNFLNNSGVISYAKIVVVIAYMRSGSTLVGSLIQQHSDTFYLFEPNRKIKEATSGATSVVTYVNGEKRTYRHSDTMNVVMNETINWMTCQLEKQSIDSLMFKALKLFTTNNCSNVRDRSLNKLNLSRIRSCLRKTVQTCRRSSLIALKFISLRMHHIKQLLPLFPNMKIIHLNRDPRGIYNSRRVLPTGKTIDDFVKGHCKAVTMDLSTSKSIIRKYPGRLKIINYENLSDDPMLVSKEIYDFIGLKFTKSEMMFIEKMTSAREDGCTFCTARKNSSETASRWRHDMADINGFNKINLIQEQCKDSNRVFGYLPLSATDLIRPGVPSRQDVNVTKTLLDDQYF